MEVRRRALWRDMQDGPDRGLRVCICTYSLYLLRLFFVFVPCGAVCALRVSGNKQIGTCFYMSGCFVGCVHGGCGRHYALPFVRE